MAAIDIKALAWLESLHPGFFSVVGSEFERHLGGKWRQFAGEAGLYRRQLEGPTPQWRLPASPAPVRPCSKTPDRNAITLTSGSASGKGNLPLSSLGIAAKKRQQLAFALDP